MSKKELNELIERIKINEGYVKKIEEIYGSIPLEVMKLLSYKDNKMFIGDWRVVSKSEVLDSVKAIHVDFASENLVPVIDTMDNDYICYDLKGKQWTYYNIVDNVKFKAKRHINDYLLD